MGFESRVGKPSCCQANGVSFEVKEAVLIQPEHTFPLSSPSLPRSCNLEAWRKQLTDRDHPQQPGMLHLTQHKTWA